MLVKGPFDLKWGDNVLAGVESISVEYEQDSDEYETIQGETFEVDGAIRAAVEVTFLHSDRGSLAAVLPQYFVANGEVLSTGETVDEANGALELIRSTCDTSEVYNNLDIISCGNPGEVLRLVNARTRVSAVEVDNRLRMVTVRFIATPASGDAYLQFFEEGSIATVS